MDYRIIGLQNEQQYRWVKQQIERLNTTYHLAIKINEDVVSVEDEAREELLQRILSFEQLTMIPNKETKLKKVFSLRADTHQGTLKRMRLVLLVNAFFTVFEAIFGLALNSAAIFSDAIHDSGDVLSIGIAWFFEKLSTKKANDMYSYGYWRFSLLGGLVTAIVLLVGSLIIIVTSLPKVIHPEVVNVTGMFWVSIFAILVNGYCTYLLMRGESSNENLLNIHSWEDVLGWLAILIMSIVLKFSNWYFLDPLLSIGISVWIIKHTLPEILKISKIFLQAVPDDIDIKELRYALLDLPEVDGISHLHIWSIDGQRHMASVMVATCRLSVEAQSQLKQEIRDIVVAYHIVHITIDVVVDPDHMIQV